MPYCLHNARPHVLAFLADKGLVIRLSIAILITGVDGSKIPREGRKEAKLCEPDLSPDSACPHVPGFA